MWSRTTKNPSKMGFLCPTYALKMSQINQKITQCQFKMKTVELLYDNFDLTKLLFFQVWTIGAPTYGSNFPHIPCGWWVVRTYKERDMTETYIGINTDIFIYTIKSYFDSRFFHDRWDEKINKGDGNFCKILKNHVFLNSTVASLMQTLQPRTCITIHLSFAICSHKSILHSLRTWASLYLCYKDISEGKKWKQCCSCKQINRTVLKPNSWCQRWM